MKYILGLDIGGTNLRLGLVDRQLTAHHVEVTSSRALFDSEDTLCALANVIRNYLARHLPDGKPKMICMGLPAVVDKQRRSVLSATNFPGLAGRDIVSEMEGALNVPVIIEHDAYYLLAYDIMANGLKNTGTMLGFYFGTGMGNAMFIDGRPYIGKNGTACEIGHMPVPLSDYPCSCGNKGCIEMYCCGKAFERLAQECFPEENLSDPFVNHPDHPRLIEFVRYMAAVVATEVNMMDPDGVFIGGGLVHMRGFPHERLKQEILANTRHPYPAANLEMYIARPAAENGIIGAAIEGWRRIDSQG
ncbi:MAG: allose kinase [Clostridiales bacterium]|nr:allose kinase [Clostridiales bacterium]